MYQRFTRSATLKLLSTGLAAQFAKSISSCDMLSALASTNMCHVYRHEIFCRVSIVCINCFSYTATYTIHAFPIRFRLLRSHPVARCRCRRSQCGCTDAVNRLSLTRLAPSGSALQQFISAAENLVLLHLYIYTTSTS